MTHIFIGEWDEGSPRWPELTAFLQQNDQAKGVLADGREPPSRLPDAHVLVALLPQSASSSEEANDIAGVLAFVVQPIGPEMDCPTLCDPRTGTPLTELKVRAFFVREERRGQGIGMALQEAALSAAKELDCFQMRSRSDFSRQANYAVKIKLGFAAHPAVRRIGDREEAGVYWVKRV